MGIVNSGKYGLAEPAIIDPAMIDAVLVTGILPPKRIGQHLHVTFYQDRISHDGRIERVVVARIAMATADFNRVWHTAGCVVTGEPCLIDA